MLPVNIATEKAPEPDHASKPESSEETSQPDGNVVSQMKNGDAGDSRETEDKVPPEKGPQDKGPQEKGPPLSPSSQTVTALWRPKVGIAKRPPGFQGQLCCVCEMTGAVVPLCYLTMSSAFGM